VRPRKGRNETSSIGRGKKRWGFRVPKKKDTHEKEWLEQKKHASENLEKVKDRVCRKGKTKNKLLFEEGAKKKTKKRER